MLEPNRSSVEDRTTTTSGLDASGPAEAGNGLPRPRPATGSPAAADDLLRDQREPDPPTDPRPTGLGVRFVRRMVVLGVALIVVAAGSAAGAAVLWPKTYTARSQILYVIAQQQPTGFLRDDLALTTQVVLLQSPAVLGPVAQHNNITLPDLTRRVSAGVESGSEIITIDVRGDSAESALRLGSEVTTQYLAAGHADPAKPPAQDYLEQQLAGVRQQLAGLTPAQLAGPLGTSAGERERDIEGQLDQLSLTQLNRPAPQLVVPPYVDPTTVTPRPLVTVGAGALLGVLVATVTVGVLVRRRLRR
jgi:hypothetical protein